MKRQQRQMLILIVVLCALGAAFFGLRQYNKTQAEKAAAEEEESILVLDVATEDVTAFSYDYQGQTYSFEKDGETWYASEDKSLSIKQSLLTGMLRGITPLTATQVLENVTDMEQYGLETSQQAIRLETAEASYTLNVGDENELTSGCYVSLPDSDTVYVVKVSDINSFEKTLEDLVEQPEESEESEK